MSNEPQLNAWWQQLPEETRIMLDTNAMTCPLQLPRWPYWDMAICAEIQAWADLWIEVLQMHSDFLAKGKARAERHGREWTVAEMIRQDRLRGIG
jgi:hypothetical protein